MNSIRTIYIVIYDVWSFIIQTASDNYYTYSFKYFALGVGRFVAMAEQLGNCNGERGYQTQRVSHYCNIERASDNAPIYARYMPVSYREI